MFFRSKSVLLEARCAKRSDRSSARVLLSDEVRDRLALFFGFSAPSVAPGGKPTGLLRIRLGWRFWIWVRIEPFCGFVPHPLAGHRQPLREGFIVRFITANGPGGFGFRAARPPGTPGRFRFGFRVFRSDPFEPLRLGLEDRGDLAGRFGRFGRFLGSGR